MKYKYFISEKEQIICNVHIPKNAIIVQVINDFGEIEDTVLCMKFPRHYNGTNPYLDIWYWDNIHQCFEPDTWKNKITQVLWNIYVKGGYKKMGKILLPQIKQVYKQVPHNTKIGHVQTPVMCDPEKKRLNETTIGYHDFTQPRQSSIYHYYSSIGTYGKAGDSMRVW